MDKNILEFVSRLRTAGLQVSPSEVIDCVKSLDYSRGNVALRKAIMQATLVKRFIDIPIFEKVYAIYYGSDEDLQSNNAKPSEGTGENPATSEQQLKQDASQARSNWKDLLKNLQQKDELSLNDMVNNAVEGLGELKKGDAENFNNLVRRTQVSMEWFMAENQMERAYWTMPYEEWLEAKKQFDKLKEKIEEAIRKKIERELGVEGQEEVLKQLNWKNKDFGALRDEEIIEMERRVTMLGKKLASRLSRRRKPGKKGIIDLRRTIKRMAAQNSIPLKFAFLEKKPAKPKLAVLCDISGSVARYSRFMLQIIYIFANRFKEIKAYVFVDGITEVTDILRSCEWKEAFDKIFREAKCSGTGYSDYGKVFERFNRQYLAGLDHKTNVIILGDARNNWFPSGIDEFIYLAERVKSILWLNPQEKEQWDTEDSIIGTYAKYVKSVEECRNLAQLESLVKKILNW